MSIDVSTQSLEALIEQAGGPVQLLRSSPRGPFVFPGIPPEFTNWRDEIRSWKDGVALLEQSYHMTELHLRGPEVIPFLKEFAVNKFDNFPVLRAKQIVLAGPDGRFIADAIIFREAEDFVRLVGGPFASDWLLFQSEQTSHDITAERHAGWSWGLPETPRDVFRFQIQGKHALDLVSEVIDGELPHVGFFSIADVSIAGKEIRALRHGMAGTPGYELYGPWDDQQAVRDAFETAGQKYGLRKVGAAAYSVTAAESGWMPTPLPAIYTGEEMRPYREWLNTMFIETIGALGGSFVSDRVEDYYVDPIELGYGGFVDWDREFLGRDALAERAANQRRAKVTLVWNDEDVSRILSDTLFSQNSRPYYISLPTLNLYATFQYDAVRHGGEEVGVSQWASYSPNARHVISTALVDIAQSEPDTEVTLLWGEPNSKRAAVDAHEVREIRATVAPVPYFEKLIRTGKQ